MESTSEAKKRSRPHTDYSRCIFCQQITQETVQRLSEQGYPTLLTAIQKRDDDTAFRLENDVASGPSKFLLQNPLCHAKCRNAYTNKKNC